MKTLKLSALFLIAILFASCDANKSKVSELAKKYVQAVNEKDKITINELYPENKSFACLVGVDTIKAEKISVEYNKADSVYIAKLNEKQSLVFKSVGKENLQICDSYGILQLDSACYELAVKTGAPINKNSDITNGRMFSDDGDFILYLAEQFPSAINGNLYESNGRYSWQGGWFPTVSFDFPITNGGNILVKGKDYTIEIIYTNRKTGERVGTSTEPGGTLAPGETHVFNVYKNELFKIASTDGLYAYVSFTFKNASTAVMLAKYASLTGKEYNEFQEQLEQDKKTANE